MPIYVNAGYPLSPDGKEWKHLMSCTVLQERQAEGFRVLRIARNMDATRSLYQEHKRRRCPVCMPDSEYRESEPHNPGPGDPTV
jgi:hypothetical protein